jgi:hypothetical protein
VSVWTFCGARTRQREQPRHVVNINADTIPLQHIQFAIRCDVRTATVHSCTDCTAHRMINVQRRIKALPKPCGSWQRQTLSTCSEAADDVREPCLWEWSRAGWPRRDTTTIHECLHSLAVWPSCSRGRTARKARCGSPMEWRKGGGRADTPSNVARVVGQHIMCCGAQNTSDRDLPCSITAATKVSAATCMLPKRRRGHGSTTSELWQATNFTNTPSQQGAGARCTSVREQQVEGNSHPSKWLHPRALRPG